MHKIKKNQTATFDVDAQKGFTPICPNELPVTDGNKIAGRLNQNANLGVLRVGSKDAHPEYAVWNANGKDKIMLHPIKEHFKNADVYWPQHCVVGTKGCELLDDLPHPQEYDYFVWKGVERDMHPYGACYHDLNDTMSTGVIEFLKNKNIENVIVGGLATDFCVFKTVMQLQQAGFQVYVVKDACKGLAPESIEQSRIQMMDAGAILVETSQEIESE